MTEYELDNQLTRALQRVDAPQDFAARLVAKAEAIDPQPAKVLAMRPRTTHRALWTGAVAAMLAVGIFTAEGLHLHHRHEEQARALASQRATQQFELATRITDRALAHTREQLLRAGVPLGD